MPVYRNQTNTMSQIVNLSHIRITTTQEAVAFLRAIQPLNEQVAFVLQKKSLADQQALNRRAASAPTAPTVPTTPTTPTTPEPEKKFEAEDLSSDEGYSESEIEAKVEKLKKSKAKKEKKEEK